MYLNRYTHVSQTNPRAGPAVTAQRPRRRKNQPRSGLQGTHVLLMEEAEDMNLDLQRKDWNRRTGSWLVKRSGRWG